MHYMIMRACHAQDVLAGRHPATTPVLAAQVPALTPSVMRSVRHHQAVAYVSQMKGCKQKNKQVIYISVNC